MPNEGGKRCKWRRARGLGCAAVLVPLLVVPATTESDSLDAEAQQKVSTLASSLVQAAGTAAQGNSQQAALAAAEAALDFWLPSIGEDVPGWLKRTEFEWDITEDSQPEFSLLTVQPLFRSPGDVNTLFVQGRAAYGRGDRKTFNIGVGFRRLFYDERLMLGVNGFFDYEEPFDHRRAGAGGEIRMEPLELNVNFYEAISGIHSADDGAFERALDGYDVELGAQVPYLPWARVFGKKFYWDAVALANDIDGERIGLRLRPFPFVEIEAGYTDDNVTPSAAFAQIRVSLGLGRTARDSGVATIDDAPFRFSSMRELTLDKVRRENTVRVERTLPVAAGGTATVTISRGT